MSVSLAALWFAKADDLSVSFAFDAPAPYSWGQAATVRQQATAAGTLRMIRSVARGARGSSITIPQLSREQVALLVEHAETAFWYRDHTGRKVSGWWDPPDVGEHEYVDDRADVSLTFHEATLSEAV